MIGVIAWATLAPSPIREIGLLVVLGVSALQVVFYFGWCAVLVIQWACGL